MARKKSKIQPPLQHLRPEIRPPASKAQIQAARDIYQNDDVEIDDDAVLSETDIGVWVSGWLWVSNEEV